MITPLSWEVHIHVFGSDSEGAFQRKGNMFCSPGARRTVFYLLTGVLLLDIAGIFVRNMLVTYDRENRKIGFWRTKCTDLWTKLNDAMNGAEDTAPPPPPEALKTSAPPPAPEEIHVGHTGTPESSPPEIQPSSTESDGEPSTGKTQFEYGLHLA